MSADNQQVIQSLKDRIVTHYMSTIDVLRALMGVHERFYENSHSSFVGQYSGEVAKYMKLPENQIFEIRTAGYLHDIGKIGLPDKILAKHPNVLKDADFNMYVKHPELGHQILQGHSGFQKVAEIVLQHHEKLDGTGFPNKLKGQSINIGARIISVVDAYHNAMFRRETDRLEAGVQHSHNAGNTQSLVMSSETRYTQVVNYLVKNSDKLFDSKVVQAFTDVLEIAKKQLGDAEVRRIAVNRLEVGMKLADDYRTSFGLLIAARGDTLSGKAIRTLLNFAESGEIPQRVLIVE